MTHEAADVSGTEMDQIKIVLNTLYLCIGYAVKHIAEHEGDETAAQFKDRMLAALKSGEINMALLEETRTFDFVIAKIEAVGRVGEAPATADGV